METITELLASIAGLPIYQHGWLLFSLLAIVPAIVSGNLVQHYLSQLIARKKSPNQIGKPLLLNLAILMICVAIMVYGFLLR